MIDDEDLEFDEYENTDVDYIIDPIREENDSITYGLYVQLLSLQNFYSKIQQGIKQVAA